MRVVKDESNGIDYESLGLVLVPIFLIYAIYLYYQKVLKPVSSSSTSPAPHAHVD
jgi:hypothetical protein